MPISLVSKLVSSSNHVVLCCLNLFKEDNFVAQNYLSYERRISLLFFPMHTSSCNYTPCTHSINYYNADQYEHGLIYQGSIKMSSHDWTDDSNNNTHDNANLATISPLRRDSMSD
ncbi:hypothetical protein TcasGA2_TC008076 [Tribolium castaneum]|uniref:Uncharacterized protein n=1 Tax=Tribolium castaneum TaxID=7070 RepID=D1ZZN8_TRICA|nr:hypothetical protein TcasGA2_TC008076 [Tribolium castaneum]